MSNAWYRRFPAIFVTETIGLSLEEKGAYSVVIDLIHTRGGPLVDNPQGMARDCGCSTYRWRRLRERLLDLGLIVIVPSGIDAPIVHVWANLDGRERIPAHVRQLVIERDGERCVYCGNSEGPFHLDHVFPASRGGASTIDNLVVACLPCNLSKGAKTPDEWRQ